MLLYVMTNAIMMGKCIKMAEKMEPFMPDGKGNAKAPKMLKLGNWERRTIPMPANTKQNPDP